MPWNTPRSMHCNRYAHTQQGVMSSSAETKEVKKQKRVVLTIEDKYIYAKASNAWTCLSRHRVQDWDVNGVRFSEDVGQTTEI